jgi:hypothetical protein
MGFVDEDLENLEIRRTDRLRDERRALDDEAVGLLTRTTAPLQAP